MNKKYAFAIKYGREKCFLTPVLSSFISICSSPVNHLLGGFAADRANI